MITKQEEKIAKMLVDNFTYVEDKKQFGLIEHHKIHKKLPFRGDCDDFAYTALYFLSDKSILKFYKNIILKKAGICCCNVYPSNDKKGIPEGHAVLFYKEKFIDNRGYVFVSKKELEENGYDFYSDYNLNIFQVFINLKAYAILSFLSKINYFKKFSHFYSILTMYFVNLMSLSILTNRYYRYRTFISFDITKKFHGILYPFYFIIVILLFVLFPLMLLLYLPFNLGILLSKKLKQ